MDANAEKKPPLERPKYLHIRDGTYYFKRKLPAAVASALKDKKATAGDVWRSLRTSDYEQALRRLESENRRFEEEFGESSTKTRKSDKSPKSVRGNRAAKYLLPEHIPQIISRYEYALMSTDDMQRREMSKEERAEHIEYLEDWIEQYRECCASEDFSPVEELAKDLLRFERLIAPPGSDVLRQLLWDLMSKDIELAETQLARARGRMMKTPEIPPVAPRDLPTLMDLYESWAEGQKEVRTRDTYRYYVEEFESLYRALPVIALKQEVHVFGYRDYLVRCGYSRDTASNRIGGLGTLVRHGMTTKPGLLPLAKNPFSDVALDMIPETPKSEQRQSFSHKQLRTIFESALYTGGLRVTGQSVEVAFWGPLLGVFAGPRIEELCQLRIEDIQRINGRWAIRIANLDPEQHLKTPGSYRVVPMHQELIACGFLKYVAQQMNAGHTRVFPSLKNKNKYKRFSNAYGKWHSEFLKELGIRGKKLSFHCYRFSFKQQLGYCGASDEVKDALLGHWLKKAMTGRGYMRVKDAQYPFPILANAVEALRYDEVNLQHLHVPEPMAGVDVLLFHSSSEP